MKKTFTKLFAALALLAFFIPSMIAVGQTRAYEELYSATFTEVETHGYTQNKTFTLNDKLWTASVSQVNGGVFYLGCNSNNASKGVLNNNSTFSAEVTALKAADNTYNTNYTTAHAYALQFNNAYSDVTKVTFNWDGGNNAFQVYLFGDSGSGYVLLGHTNYATSGATVSGSVEWTGSATNYTKFAIVARPGAANSTATNKTLRPATFYIYKTTGAETVATPEFSHSTNTYYGPQNVTISCETEGAEIHYTMGANPSDPTASSDLYEGSISVTETTTIKAIAIKDDMEDSEIATTTLTIADPVFNQDWEGAMNGWTFVNITGDQVWNVSSYSGNHYAKMSGYASGNNNANEDWCISPAFDLEDYLNPILTFTTARNNQNGNELEVYFSNDYNGTNVSSATWTQLTCTLPAQPSSGYTDFTSSGNIDLSSYSGKNCYIGFKYTSTTSAAVTWELDDIVLASQTTTPTITLTPSSIDAGSNNPTGTQISKTFTVSQSNLTEAISLEATSGTLSPSSVALDAGDTEITWTYTPTEAGSINVTITATSSGVEQTLTISGTAVAPITGDCYELVATDPADWNGYYIFTGINSGTYYALTGVVNSLGTTASVNVIGTKIASNNETDGYRIHIETTDNGHSLYMENVGYLKYTGSSNSLLASAEFEESTCEWTLEYDDNVVIATNVGNDSRILQFNYNSGGTPRFACYGNSGQTKLTLFKYTGTVVLPPVINVTENTINLACDATSGTISYTISNPTGATLTASTTTSWIKSISYGENAVLFAAYSNESGVDREGTITLSYAGAADKNVTISQSHYVTPASGESWVLTNLSDLTASDVFVIVGTKTVLEENTYFALPNNGSQILTNKPEAVSISISGTALVNAPANNLKWNVGGNSTDGYIFYPSGVTDLALVCTTTANSSNNDKIGVNMIENYTRYRFVLDENNYLITKDDYATRYLSVYNDQDWRGYLNTTNGALPISFYKRVASSTDYTVEMSGCGTNPGNWHLIASPLSTSVPATAVENLVSDNYDLFRFNQSSAAEWENYLQHEHFYLENGKGYLYATKETVTLKFSGAAYDGDGVVNLSYDGDATFAGWNLIGNPFAEEATVNSSYYKMNNGGTELEATTEATAVAAMQGIFVKATTTGQSVTFSTGEKRSNDSKVVLNVIDNDGNVIDRTIVCFNEGRALPKFMLDESNTKIYIPQTDTDYAIVSSDGHGTMPVNFKAKEMGRYTISIEIEGIEMSNLHLTDRLTGENVDLLRDKKYSFIASNSDIESRFILSFTEKGYYANNETFAFQNGNDIIVNGEGELQIFDVMGRMVKNTTINGVEAIAMPQGVYIFKLNGNVQKIVVR